MKVCRVASSVLFALLSAWTKEGIAAESVPPKPPSVTYWDAVFHVLVRGELRAIGDVESEDYRIVLSTLPNSPVFPDELTKVNGSAVKNGKPFEYHFEMIWGGSSVEGGKSPGLPILLLSIEDRNGACSKVVIDVRTLGGDPSGVVLDLGKVVPVKKCLETGAATWVVES